MMNDHDETTTAAQALMRCLEHEGISYIFGIPGGPLMPLYEAMQDNGRIAPIISKHEEGAAFMADGYARVRGGLGVCCATTGPGATNALTGIACAQSDSVPVLLLTAQVALEAFGKGAAQESSAEGLDTVELYRAATKASLMLVSPEKAWESVRSVLRRALTGRTGAVHLSMPANMMKQPTGPPGRPPLSAYRARHACSDRAAVEAAAKLLIEARRPAILAGHGTNLGGAWSPLRRLAERLCIPVATSPKGKGAFPEHHRLSLGVLGFAGSPQAERYCMADDVDVLLVVGSGLGEQTTNAWDERLQPTRALIHTDVDPEQIGKNYPTEAGLVGDAGTVLNELLEHAERELRWLESPDLETRERQVREHKETYPRVVERDQLTDDSVPMKPQRLVHELDRTLPGDAILFVDIGNVMAWAIHYLTVRRPGTFHINMGLASMGYAGAASVGGQLAAPDRPVVALLGDAAFAMNGMEVHTAVENEVPVVWVVMNNGGHGMVTHGERLQFKGKLRTGPFRRPLDVARIAEGLGARAETVEAPGDFPGLLQSAIRSGRPTVIDARIDPEAMPPFAMRIKTLDRFFQGDEAAPSEQVPAPASASEVVVRPQPELSRMLDPAKQYAGNGGNGNDR